MTRHLDEKRLTGSNPSHWSETESTGRPSVRDADYSAKCMEVRLSVLIDLSASRCFTELARSKALSGTKMTVRQSMRHATSNEP
jgi:hypothetical protein